MTCYKVTFSGKAERIEIAGDFKVAADNGLLAQHFACRELKGRFPDFEGSVSVQQLKETP